MKGTVDTSVFTQCFLHRNISVTILCYDASRITTRKIQED